MTDKQKYAIKIAIDTMNKHFSRHCNVVYGNRETGVSVWYGEAINILSDMLSNTDNHTCNCKHNSNSRDNEPCCGCDGSRTNADRIRNMSDEELADVLFDSCLEVMKLEECTNTDNCEVCKRCVLEWLRSEAEQSRRKDDEQ